MKRDFTQEIDRVLEENKEVISKYWFEKVMDLLYNPTQVTVCMEGVVDMLDRRPGDGDWYYDCHRQAMEIVERHDKYCDGYFHSEAWILNQCHSCIRCREVLWSGNDDIWFASLISPTGHFNGPCWNPDHTTNRGEREYINMTTRELVFRGMEYTPDYDMDERVCPFFSFK